MENFKYQNPTKLIFGKGQIQSLGQEIPADAERVLLLYGGGSIKKNGVHDQVMAQLKEAGKEVVELSGVEPNPRLTTVQKGIDLVKEHELDLF